MNRGALRMAVAAVQRVTTTCHPHMREKPRKSPRVPPTSATKVGTGGTGV